MKIKVNFFRMALVFLFAIFLIVNKENVSANSIENITMNIDLQDNGEANITEIWQVDADNGTEIYHPYYNLGKSEIKDLNVKLGGNYYNTVSSWNVDGSFNSKANKCGLHKISDGVEICWGISNYGINNTYTVSYKITNFVAELSDTQMIYWTLIPYELSNEVGKVDIVISSNSKIFPDTMDVWGFGCSGAPCFVSEGKIYMSANNLSSSEYMTLLVNLGDVKFNTSNYLDNEFDYYLNMAKEGAEEPNVAVSKGSIIEDIFVISIFFIPFIITLFVFLNTFLRQRASSFKYGKYGSNISRNIQYFREVPKAIKNDLPLAYYICKKYNIVKNRSNIIGAYLLKWINENKIKLLPEEVGLLLKKKSYKVVLDYTGEFNDKIESSLYKYMYKASKDGILENKEFAKWAQENYYTIEDWFKKIDTFSEEKLVSMNLLQKVNCKALWVTEEAYAATEEFKNIADELAGLKRYLKDYTLISERETPTVALFEEYLIFAQLFGIADKVQKEFSRLYPELITQTNYNDYNYVYFANYYGTSMINAVNNAHAYNSYSSGGGGFSFGGGGGGSFGGGGGGGGFR